MGDYAGGDRRPIASRELRVFQRMAAALAKAGVSANAISVAGMVFGIIAGGLLASTRLAGEGAAERWLFVAAAVCIQLRLLANMLDGMVAIASGRASATGELFNEIPDRISDTAILVGAGYGAGGMPTWGWAAACMALFVTYIRAMGKGMGVPGLFQGPMAKSHRMALLTFVCVVMAIVPRERATFVAWNGQPAGALAVALELVIILGAVTAWRRLAALHRALKQRGRDGEETGGGAGT
jgi:phosphatidylglycerophosphate synthase